MEKWKKVKGFEKSYEVSNLGRVRSLDREVNHGRGGKYILKGKVLKGNISNHGYQQYTLKEGEKKKIVLAHQVVAQAFLDYEIKGFKKVVDHIDNNKQNNKLDNLQVISVRENTSKDRKNKSSKYTGVSWNKAYKKWYAEIRSSNKRWNLGLFKTEEEAHNQYQAALKQLNETGDLDRRLLPKPCRNK